MKHEHGGLLYPVKLTREYREWLEQKRNTPKKEPATLTRSDMKKFIRSTHAKTDKKSA